MELLPKALSHTVLNATGVRRQPIKFGTASASDVPSGQSIRARFPQGILDLSTFTMQAKVVITGTSGTVRAQTTALYKYMQSVRFYCGGQLVSGGQCNFYNVLKNVLLKCQTDPQTYSTKALNNMIEDVKIRADDASNNVLETFLIEDNWLGLPMCGGKYFNTDIFGDLEIEIILAPNTVIKGWAPDVATKGALDYELQNIKFVVDRVSPPPMYLELLKNKVKSAEPIKLAYQNFVHQKAVLNGSNRLNLSTQCLDAFLALPCGSNVAEDEYENGEFIYGVSGTVQDAATVKQWQLLVGENSIPNYPENGLMAYDYTSNCFQRDMLGNHNQLALSNDRVWAEGDISKYLSHNYVIGIDLTLEGKSGHVDGVLGGVNTNGSSVDIQFNTQGYDQSKSWHFFCLTTAHLSRETSEDGMSSRVVVNY